MTPEQFLAEIDKRGPAPAYLFLGPEAYFREICRKALIERALPPEERETGLTRHDLSEVSLAEVLDDVRSMSLFASSRLIYVTSAEAALPRGRNGSGEDGGEEASPRSETGGELLRSWLAHPSPGVVVVFECSRYGFQGEDKNKIERVRKFYGAIQKQVEFPHLDERSALQLASALAKEKGLSIGRSELAMLVDSVAADAFRIATELEKLSLLTEGRRPVTVEDILAMAPDARASNIFALVAALGRGDRRRSLEILDSLIREGEYLPLALSFLATQCRLALVAAEANLRSASHIEAYFRRLGAPMWRARAEQIAQTLAAFPKGRLQAMMQSIYAADKALRDTRPDDRVVMEKFVLELTGR